jgi:hypothetical protein
VTQLTFVKQNAVKFQEKIQTAIHSTVATTNLAPYYKFQFASTLDPILMDVTMTDYPDRASEEYQFLLQLKFTYQSYCSLHLVNTSKRFLQD